MPFRGSRARRPLFRGGIVADEGQEELLVASGMRSAKHGRRDPLCDLGPFPHGSGTVRDPEGSGATFYLLVLRRVRSLASPRTSRPFASTILTPKAGGSFAIPARTFSALWTLALLWTRSDRSGVLLGIYSPPRV